MPKSHKSDPAALKARLVGMVRAGRNPEELATKFEPTAQVIRNWVRQGDLDAGRRQDGLTTEEREELRRLRLIEDFLRRSPSIRSSVRQRRHELRSRMRQTRTSGSGAARLAAIPAGERPVDRGVQWLS